MAKRFLMPILAALVIIAMVIPGCEREPKDPVPAGSPVEVIILGRIEDERAGMAQYLGDLIADLGFAVDVRIKTAGEAAPFWQSPLSTAAGEWHVYTGGWVYTLVSRDESTIFYWTFASKRGWGPYPLHEPSTELEAVATTLFRREFTTALQRQNLFQQALELSAEDGLVVYTVDTKGFNPYRKNVNLATDTAAGIYGSRLWGLTSHFHSDFTPIEPTGTSVLKVGTPSIVTNPWNPIDGSNWVYDMMPIRATGDSALYTHPQLGYWLNQRLQSATVTVLDTLPVEDPHPTLQPWLSVNRVASITVPDEAWASWNTTAKQWITAAERVADPLDTYEATAPRKSTVVYDLDLGKWHDGSDVSLADFLMVMIADFERGMPGGEFYDPAFAPSFGGWFPTFKGIQITNTSPLTIDYYSTSWSLDPCWSVTTFYPFYAQGPAAWHNLALGILAEKGGQLTFGKTKGESATPPIPWMDFTRGPSLAILGGHLNALDADPTVTPYFAFFDYWYDELGWAGDDFEDEAADRFANLKDFYDDGPGHFWLGTGPFYLETATAEPGFVELKKNLLFTDPGDKWFAYLADPAVGAIPVVEGAWVDTVRFVEQTVGLALPDLNAGDMDMFAFSITDAELYEALLDNVYPNVTYRLSFGSWSEFLFNPVLFPEDDTFNPFGLPKVREAVSWLIDRDTIANEIYGGMAVPKYTPLLGAFPEATERYPGLVAAMVAKYTDWPADWETRIEDALTALQAEYPGLWFNTTAGLWYWDPDF